MNDSRTLSACLVGWYRVTVAACVCSFLATALDAQIEDADEKFLNGLRERRLNALAVEYCQQRLDDQSLDQRARLDYTLELIRCYSSWSRQQSGEFRSESIRLAREAAESFLETGDALPRAILVRVQRALMNLQYGQTLRLEYEVGLQPDSARAEALQALAETTRELEGIDRWIETEAPKRFRETEEGQLNGEQLLSLQQRVRFQRGIANKNRALLYGEDDDLNRIDALVGVIAQYDELSTAVSQVDELWWQVQVEHSDCLRRLGRSQDAAQLIASLPEEVPFQSVQAKLVEQELRLKLDAGDVQQALAIGLAWSDQGNSPTPELDQAILEAALAISSSDSLTETQRSRWQEQAVMLAREIARKHGPFWGRRADLQLVGVSTSGAAIENIEILMQLADEHYLNQRYPEAIEGYRQTMAAAQTQQQVEQWFQAGRKAGVLLFQLERSKEASQLLREISVSAKTQTGAVEAHQQAVWIVGQAAGSDPSRIDEYIELLEENITLWHDKAVSDQTRMWLGKAYQFNGQAALAFDVYLDVRLDAELVAPAIRAATEAADKHVSKEAELGRESAPAAGRFADRLESLLPSQDSEQPWDDAAAWACVGACRLRIIHQSGDLQRAGELLQQLVNQSVQGDETWLSEANALLVVALASQPEAVDEIRKLLAASPDAPKQRLFEVIETLKQMTAAASQVNRVALAEATLTVVESVEASFSLTEPEQLALQRNKALMLARAEKIDDSISVYETLLRSNPRNGALLEELATILSESDVQENIEDALLRWRQLAQGSRPQSTRWFRAKYQIGKALLRLAREEEAVRFLRFLKETPPGWEESLLREAFETLLKEAEQ